jgi:hypothetical protein
MPFIMQCTHQGEEQGSKARHVGSDVEVAAPLVSHCSKLWLSGRRDLHVSSLSIECYEGPYTRRRLQHYD